MRLDPAWLVDAEVSLPLDGSDRFGLSLFTATPANFARLVHTLAAPERLVAQEEAVRAAFEVAPRHWLKLDLSGGQIAGYSQYWQLNPARPYAVTSLRMFLRRHGQAEVGWVEPAFRPVLEHPRSAWLVALKDAGDRPRPRLVGRLVAELLPAALVSLVAAGRLTAPVAESYRQALDGHLAGFVYLSLDAERVDGCSIDLEQPDEALLAPWRRLGPGLPAAPRYLKLRVEPATLTPGWKAYLPLRALAAPLADWPEWLRLLSGQLTAAVA